MATPSNIQIIAYSVTDDTTLVNDDTDALYPLDNLQMPQSSLKWRTSSVVEQQLVSDLTEFEAVSGWSLNAHNLSFGSVVRLSLYNTVTRGLTVNSITWSAGVATITFAQLHGIFDDGGDHAVYLSGLTGATELDSKVSDCVVVSTNVVEVNLVSLTAYVSGGTGISLHEVYDESQDGLPVQYGWGQQPWGLGGWYGYGKGDDRQTYLNFWFDSVVTDFMRVIITDTANPDGYVEAGRMILGLSMKPKYNMLFGAGIDYRSQTKAKRTRSGSIISDNRPSYRVADMQLSYLSESEAMLLLDMMNNPGTRGDALISMYPDDKGILGQRTTILGRFMQHSPIKREKTGYTLTISFQEAL